MLQECFWRMDDFKEFGIFVLRFYKDCSVMYVIIDDRVPVNVKDGRPVFAYAKDPNELWVCFIEKAYAKLHGCYKAIIGGYCHNGLCDMTGFPPRLMVFKSGFEGYNSSLDDATMTIADPVEKEKAKIELVWDMLVKYRKWNSLMGCSIQNKDKKAKAEAHGEKGLIMGHAYSFLDLNTIQIPGPGGKGTEEVRLVRVRNPWGRGEWEGDWSDDSEQYAKHQELIVTKFTDASQEKVEENAQDGTFFMRFEDWYKQFTHLFVALHFPASWSGKQTQGVWNGELGGNRKMDTWMGNPRIRLFIKGQPGDAPDAQKQVFVGLYIKDTRLTLGFDYYTDPLYATALAFDIVAEDELMKASKQSGEVIKESNIVTTTLKDQKKTLVKQPAYMYGTTQVIVSTRAILTYFPPIHTIMLITHCTNIPP